MGCRLLPHAHRLQRGSDFFRAVRKGNGDEGLEEPESPPTPVPMLRVSPEPGLACLFPLAAGVSSGIASQGTLVRAVTGENRGRW